MDWLNTIVTAFVALVGAFGGGSIIYWRATRKTKDAEANKTTTEARLAESDFAEKNMSKQRDKSGKFVRTTPDYKAMYLQVEKERDEFKNLYMNKCEHHSIIVQRVDEEQKNNAVILHEFKKIQKERNFLLDHCPFWVKWLYKRQFKEGCKNGVA